MKSIALMTWHHAENYGTAFQAFALKELIEQLGHEVTVINYLRDSNNPAKLISLKAYVKDYIKSEISSKERKEFRFLNEVFDPYYRANFVYTVRCSSRQDLERLNDEFDGFVCGGDQIWGPRWFDSHFYLDFVENHLRTISYAPSLGVINLKEFNCSEEIRKLTSRISNISVREQSGCDEIQALTGRNDIVNVVDPALAIGAEFWERLIEREEYKIDSEPYMFIFFLMNNNEYIENAIQEAKKKGLKPLVMHCTQSSDTKFANIEAPSPIALLKVIRNAAFVSTDSFHILVFSILFRVQFLVYNKYTDNAMSSQNFRLIELMDKLGIVDHIYKEGVQKVDAIDYKPVHDRLIKYQTISIDYLKNAIESLPDGKGKYVRRYDCEDCQICQGEDCIEFEDYWINRGSSGKMFKRRIVPWNFHKKEKCFGCEKLMGRDRKFNDTRPKFYNEIKEDLNSNISPSRLYFKYYFPYDLIEKIKQIIGKNK